MNEKLPNPNGHGARAAAHDLTTEPFPDWLIELESRRMKEYTDVNEAEKKMMAMWNLHVTQCNVTGDVQIPYACRRFVELHGRDIVRENLYRNFCLHITNLYDFGLLSVEDVRDVIDLYHSQRKRKTQSMEMEEVSSDEEEVKILHENKRKSREMASNSICSNERSPLKRLATNLDDTVMFRDDRCSASPIRSRTREPSFSAEVEDKPSIHLPSWDTKYSKKSKREKFPSYD